MQPFAVSKQREPIRLFRADWLERLTHVPPWIVPLVWGPVVTVFFVRGVLAAGTDRLPWVGVPLGFLLGLLVWSLAEYLLHRFVFHHWPKTPRQERISFLFHGIHHAQPQVPTRLVMPLLVSVPLASLHYGLALLIVSWALGRGAWVDPIFSGFLLGYISYDLIHYSLHHPRHGHGHGPRWLRELRRHHMLHHGRMPDRRFGVTSPLWDWVFGTLPRSEDQRPQLGEAS